MAIGGSVESISLDGRTFSVTADSDVSKKFGGFENEIQMNGDGTSRIIKTRVPLSIEGLVISVDDDRGDREFLNELSQRSDFFPFTITLASGAIYQASVQLVGEVQSSTQNSTAQIALHGAGKITKQ